MIIEQDQRQLREAIAFHSRANVRSIRLSQSRVWSQPLSVLAAQQEVSFDISFDPGDSRKEGACVALETDFKLTVTDNSVNRTPMVVIECKFEAEYELAPGFDPSDEQVNAFRSANAVFNCWSFFREYVVNTSARMNFPPPPIPFLRIIPKQPDSEKLLVADTPLVPARKPTGARKKKKK